MSVPILAYHHIQEGIGGCLPYTTLKQFSKQIEFLHENEFHSISIRDYVNGKTSGDKNVIITFDDAYKSVFCSALPILKRFGFAASVFIITKFVDDWNHWDYSLAKSKAQHCSWDELRQLASEGWEVGSHTVTHSRLNTISEATLWHEIRYSKVVIENELDIAANVFSYPFGWFDPKTIKMVKQAGYEAGCTLGYSSRKTNLPR